MRTSYSRRRSDRRARGANRLLPLYAILVPARAEAVIAGRRARLTRLRFVLSVALMMVAVLVATPRELLAHAHMTRSVPRAGATLTSPPDVLRLWFSEAPELPFTRIRLLGPDSLEIALGPISRISGEPLGVVVPIESRLAAGRYTVTWRTAAADGHPTHGQFSFVVLTTASAGASAKAAPPSTSSAISEQHLEMMQRHLQGAPHVMGGTPVIEVQLGAESPAYIVVRWLTFCAMLGLVGSIAFRWLVLPLAERLGRRGTRAAPVTQLRRTLLRRLAATAALAAAILIGAAIARLVVQSIAIHGARRAWNAPMLGEMVMRTAWGAVWLTQVLAAIAALLVCLVAIRFANGGARGAAAWAFAAAGVLVLAFTPALGGHAASGVRLTLLAIAADGLHVLAAGGWLGTLFVLGAVGVPTAVRSKTPEFSEAIADLVGAFSPVALVFAALVVVSGITSSWLRLGRFGALWDSTYGRILLLKLAVLVPVLGTGAYNWLRVRPALPSPEATARLKRTVAVELLIGALVVAITAVLVAAEPPR